MSVLDRVLRARREYMIRNVNSHKEQLALHIGEKDWIELLREMAPVLQYPARGKTMTFMGMEVYVEEWLHALEVKKMIVPLVEPKARKAWTNVPSRCSSCGSRDFLVHRGAHVCAYCRSTA